jgi:hypothetical protein
VIEALSLSCRPNYRFLASVDLGIFRPCHFIEIARRDKEPDIAKFSLSPCDEAAMLALSMKPLKFGHWY